MTDTQSDQQPWDRAERDTRICARYLAGVSLAQIALSFDMTPERARQIVRKAGLTVSDFGRTTRESQAQKAGR